MEQSLEQQIRTAEAQMNYYRRYVIYMSIYTPEHEQNRIRGLRDHWTARYNELISRPRPMMKSAAKK